MLDLSWLLGMYSKDSFLTDIWQKKPKFFTTGREGYFADLFSGAAVEHAVEFSQPHPPSIRLASSRMNEKQQVPYGLDGRIDIDKLRKLYWSGQTVVLNMVENFHPAVAQLARSLETEMGARIQVNSYLTPPRAQGFRPHYDTHDVMVAQVEGQKLWKLHGADAACPLEKMTNGDPTFTEQTLPPEEVLLKPGDLLYIPRGWIHEAETTDTASLHLTIGIHPPLGKDLLLSAVECLCLQHPELRQALPIGRLSDATNKEAVADRFAQLMALFHGHASAADASAAIDEQLRRRGRSGGDGHLFKDLNSLHKITGETMLQRRDNVPCKLVITDDSATLQFLNGQITGPRDFEIAMRFAMDHVGDFAVSELPSIEPDKQLALAMSMVTDGLCRLPDSAW